MDQQQCPQCGAVMCNAVGTDNDYQVLVAVCPACFATILLEVLWRGERVVRPPELPCRLFHIHHVHAPRYGFVD